MTAKEGMWTVGLTEVDAASHSIENAGLLEAMKGGEEGKRLVTSLPNAGKE